MSDREAVMAELITHLSTGRANAVSIGELREKLRVVIHFPVEDGGTFTGNPPAASTVRAQIHEAQAAGFPVLSSPRAGVWIAADEGEVLDVLDELRETVTAIEKRMQLINGGRCALRSCRAELTEKVRNRGGLYCRPEHRYQAAVERSAS